MLYSPTMQLKPSATHLAHYIATLIPMAWRSPADSGSQCPHCLNVIDLRFEDPEPMVSLRFPRRDLNDAELVLASTLN